MTWQDPGAEPARPRGRTVLVALGLLLCGAALALGCWAVFELTRVGTCASGGPYVSARPCPGGTGTKILAVTLAPFLGLAGLACVALGRRGRPRGTGIGIGTVMWSLTFLGIAAACALGAFGPHAPEDNPGARIAAIVLLVVFVPMGLAPLLGGALFGRWSRQDRERRAAGAVPLDRRVTVAPRAAPSSSAVPFVAPPPASPGAPAPDPVAQLERLQRLHESGAIDAGEYERLKARIIAGL